MRARMRSGKNSAGDMSGTRAEFQSQKKPDRVGRFRDQRG